MKRGARRDFDPSQSRTFNSKVRLSQLSNFSTVQEVWSQLFGSFTVGAQAPDHRLPVSTCDSDQVEPKRSDNSSRRDGRGRQAGPCVRRGRTCPEVIEHEQPYR